MNSELYKHSRLSEVDMEMWERKFHKFMSPTELKAQYDRLFTIMGTLDFFYRAGLMFMRDAYITAKFGNIKNSEKVRLVPNNKQENDCEVIEDGRTYRHEILELIERDAKKAEEYRKGQPVKYVTVTDEEMKQNFLNGIKRFENLLKSREKRLKDEESTLVVHFNVYELENDKPFINAINKIFESVDHNYCFLNFIRHGKVYRFGPFPSECKIFYNRNGYV